VDPAALRSSVVERFAADRVVTRTLGLYERALAGRAFAGRARRGSEAAAPLAAAPPLMPPPTALPVIVGFRHKAVDQQLAGLPSVLRSRLEIVTDPSSEVAPPDGAGPAPRSGPGRVAWLVRHPLAAIRRRLAARRRPAAQLERRRALVAQFVAERPGPIALLPLDADDLLAAEPVLDGRVTLAVGGLRSLADAWDQAEPTSGAALRDA
jgi:hypothetical protein